MNVLENFKNLFIEIWQQGIAGINFTQIGVGIVIFLLFLLLRGLILLSLKHCLALQFSLMAQILFLVTISKISLLYNVSL
mgnify:CR=1 FL=1